MFSSDHVKMVTMKTLILTLILASFSAFAAQEITTDSLMDAPAGLTDEQTKAANEFVHTGLQESTKEEECKKRGLKKCNQGDANPSGFMGIIEQNLGRAYTMLFGGTGFMTGGGGPSIKRKEAAPEVGKDGKPVQPAPEASKAADKGKDAKKDESVDDYCMYAAMGYEGISLLLQTTMQDKASKKADHLTDPQLKSLVILKETHKARGRTSAYQAGVYGAVSLCYVGYAATIASKKDWKLWTKMGGAALLTTIYGIKSKKHFDAAKQVQKVIDSLPEAGDCNPWTKTSCFCSEPTSKTAFADLYNEVCVLNAGNIDGENSTLGCAVITEGKASIDAECKCKQTNSCANRTISLAGGSFGLGGNFMDQNAKNLDILNDTNFSGARLGNLSTKSAALASRALNNRKTKAAAVSLTPEEKANADELGKIIPSDLAAIAAKSPVGDSPTGGLMTGNTRAALSKVSDEDKKKLAAVVKSNYKTGSGHGGMSSDASDEFVMPKMPGTEEQPQGAEVVTFAERAMNNADVSNSPDTPLFDIISNRYRRSAWSKLEPTSAPKN
jgi:hypothetical protein